MCRHQGMQKNQFPNCPESRLWPLVAHPDHKSASGKMWPLLSWPMLLQVPELLTEATSGHWRNHHISLWPHHFSLSSFRVQILNTVVHTKATEFMGKIQKRACPRTTFVTEVDHNNNKIQILLGKVAQAFRLDRIEASQSLWIWGHPVLHSRFQIQLHSKHLSH